MSQEDHEDRDPTLAAVKFAHLNLGPYSESYLTRPEVQVSVLSRLRAGSSLEDATLAAVFRVTPSDRRIADEFLAYFLADLMRVGDATLSPALHRYLDSGDLVQSVLGDVWTEFSGITFDTRGQFLSYMTTRIRWKAAGKHRKLTTRKRREDRRIPFDAETIGQLSDSHSPSAMAGQREERDLLILRMLRLSERDREILTRHLRGESLDEMATALELSPAAARKALQRAVQRTRQK